MNTYNEPLQVLEPAVLLIVFDPLVDPTSGARLSQVMGWNRVEDLAAGYIADVLACSGGLVRYRVVARRDVAEFPVKADGFTYTPASYLDVVRHRAAPHSPDEVDYPRLVDTYGLVDSVREGGIDEVWMFGFPFSGFYESRMAGAGAFWCNAPPLSETQGCPRRFVMMGFSYERGVGEMLENLGHRAESVLEHVFHRTGGQANLWQRFTLYDKIAPGQAQVGNVHFAPNSVRDYDWGNRRTVLSGCDDWLNFPDLRGITRPVNCAEWGNGDIRRHHTWWLSHLPKAPGRIQGIANNWWKYIIQVDHPELDS